MRRFRDLGREISWKTIIGETLIIIVGVALGIQVSNWNDERLERKDLTELLRNVQPELDNMLRAYRQTVEYYNITQDYAQVALKGWDEPNSVSDRDFVIAAYQASQIAGLSTSGENWSRIFGAEQVQSVEDDKLRDVLVRVLSLDWQVVSWTNLQTDYREHVRQVIPIDIQTGIRSKCGDRFTEDRLNVLPRTCRLRIDSEEARTAASLLRAKPELAEELRWHLAQIATYRHNLDTLATFIEDLDDAIDDTNA